MNIISVLPDFVHKYSKTSMNPDSSFTLDDSNSFLSPYEISSDSSRKQIYIKENFLILSWYWKLCVFIRIASPRRF